ncbi:transmembrane and coiled-coil domain-containing protein 4-like [Saccostrea echinata]|uniref:transmembrane and coiled-coil domain-containing protein 4-like n=1 Tax=Saccostrea echinata TaxID=191078 RepID=UPI002A8358C5|nr:transmembrane and coiled-coil domain-containing protein 4-like [Saccostrea echinata]
MMATKSLVASLTDVGSYSYSALCAVSLSQLFDEQDSSFKKKTLEQIMKHLCLSKQASESIMVMMEDNCCDDPRAFADSLLEEECLQKNGLPVITDLVTLAVCNGHYDARMRTLIKYIAWQIRINWDQVEDIESLLADSLEAREYKLSEEEEKEKAKTDKRKKIKRIALIGLATVGGGTLIGLTGGLAAPLVAAGAGAIIGGAGAAALGSTAGVAIIGSLFGVAGAGLGGYKMKRRFGAVEEFKFEPLMMDGKQLHVTIAVTGWLSKEMPDFKMPWQSLAESREQYSLRWETKYLMDLGEAFDYILNGAMGMATQEALKYTIVSGLLTAIAWPSALLSAANVLDNPWNVCIQRATSTGKELAEALLARQQGNRPVTLIGYSLGARVIFSCLEEMVKRKGCEGIVEDVVLLGAPVSGSVKQWEKLSHVVAGRIINGYTKGDWLLKFLFRTANVHFTTVAGLGPVKWNNRRMHNIDLSDVVSGHRDYMKQLPTILKVVGIRTKEAMVRGKVPPHKLFPKSESCDSFTSSEEETEEGPQSSKGHSGKDSKSTKNQSDQGEEEKKEVDRSGYKGAEIVKKSEGAQEEVSTGGVEGDKSNSQLSSDGSLPATQAGTDRKNSSNTKSEEYINSVCDRNKTDKGDVNCNSKNQENKVEHPPIESSGEVESQGSKERALPVTDLPETCQSGVNNNGADPVTSKPSQLSVNSTEGERTNT